jgi:hypothetical protein
MTNSVNDGLSKPDQLSSVNGQVTDFGQVTGSGNTSVVTFAKTFTAAPEVIVMAQVGSVAVANSAVVSAIGTGSFSIATGSNIATSWIAIGSGNY